MGAISYNSRSNLVLLQGKANSARYSAQVVNPVLLPFLRQEGDVLFQQDNARPHTPAATQRALRGVQQLPCLARSPDLSPIEHVWDMMKRNVLESLPQPLPYSDNVYKMLGTIYRRMIFGAFMSVCMGDYTPALTPLGYPVY